MRWVWALCRVRSSWACLEAMYALTLTKNTVATHVKRIYQKIDVHSCQELLDLIEERR